MYFLLIIASILPFCLGGCLNPDVVQHFNVPAYLGKWYEQEKYPQIFQVGGRCTTAEYSLNDDGTVHVLNTEQIIGDSTSSIEGTAKLVGQNGEAKLDFSIDLKIVSPHAPYWVVDTDYTSYALVWSCQELFGVPVSSTAWILTREQNPPQSLINQAYAKLEAQGIDTNKLKKTDQTNCD
ncbi:unnamed protein product [Psylliodes chrysocephalus]|uniref:Apolipoprotein D n=1 Tax=Psylliodes chrysocephalus TaxID=3402493 RepID=A0A9P0D6Q0_9CUCU|nr:unnamed protein product [Psylliodes chrysocephala]